MPASTSSREFNATGSRAKCQSCVAVSTINSAAAPPGGCRQRSRNMSAMASATAAAATAMGGSGSQCRQAMPTSAETVLPPSTAQGWASGLAGRPKTSTALAPSGATSQGRPGASTAWLNTPASRMPRPAPSSTRRRSRALTACGAGRSAFSSASARWDSEAAEGMDGRRRSQGRRL